MLQKACARGSRFDRKVVFFGCPLDCDERHDSVEEKRAAAEGSEGDEDPYEGVMKFLREEVGGTLWEEAGSMEVPGWLRPIPDPSELERVAVEHFVDFIDRDGCREFARRVGDLIEDRIFPRIPCMIAVDHSLTGGAYGRVSKFYGKEAVSLVVLDSHTDAIPVSILSEAIMYDMETNPASPHDPNDPFLRNRPESFNACSFIYSLLEEEWVDPKNLYIIGVGDYPPKQAFRVKDTRIKRYVGLYAGLKRRGATILTKKDLLAAPSRVKAVLGKIDTPYLYISVDMDIGARNAVEGVRFRDRQGLNEKQLYGIADRLGELISEGHRLAGMDVMEMNPRILDPDSHGGGDRTFRIAANLIKKICFGM
jgi:arginase family enzyme